MSTTCPKCGYGWVMNDVNKGCSECGWRPPKGVNLPLTEDDIDRKTAFLRDFFSSPGGLVILTGVALFVILAISTGKDAREKIGIALTFVAGALALFLLM